MIGLVVLGLGFCVFSFGFVRLVVSTSGTD